MSNADQIRQRLVESGLMTAENTDEQIDRWRQETGARDAEGEALLRWMVEEELITELESVAVAAGHRLPLLIGPYRVTELVPGPAGLFTAIHEELGQKVTLKLFPLLTCDDPQKQEQVAKELRVAVALNDPHVVRTFQVGRVGAVHYLAMEPLEGESLATRLDREGYLPFEDACRIGRDVALALWHLHDNDVVHRDVRPDNIWITLEGAAKLMGFGAARDEFVSAGRDEGEDADTTGSGELDADDLVLDDVDVDGPVDPDATDLYHARPPIDANAGDLADSHAADVSRSQPTIDDYAYIAPEQAHDPSQADALSDLYALGSTIYHCLTARPPFDEDNAVRQVVKLLCDEPEPVSNLNADVPEHFDDTMEGLLAKTRDDRFQKAKHAVFALEQYLPEDSERVVVVEVSDEYLQWVQESSPQESLPGEEAVGASPELADFLDQMVEAEARREQRKKKEPQS